MQPVYCLNPDTGTEIWRLDRAWEFQRGFIGPSVWKHYIGRFGIDETFHSEKDKVDEARAAFERQFQCALVGGPISVPLSFKRSDDSHSIFIAVVRGPAREWSGYLSDCLLYEFGEDGKPVSMGTLPQDVDGSQFCVRGSDLIWKCQNETFVKVSPARSAPIVSMGPGGSDCTFNLAWVRRVQYEDPEAWFIAGKGRDPVAFSENYAYSLPDGGYVLRETNRLYSFPIAAIDLSSGLDTILTLHVPFKGSFPLPDSNMSIETLVDGTESHHALSWRLLTVTDLATRGRTLEITLANETQSSLLAFDVEDLLAKAAPGQRESANNSAVTAHTRALAIPAGKLNEALDTAAEESDPEFVKALLDAGADPKYASSNGWTALMTAATYGNGDIVDTLIAAGSDVNAADKNCCGSTVLMWAARSGRDAKQKVRCLLKAGANLKGTNQNGFDALMLAASWGKLDVAEYLVNAGLSVSNRTPDGESALMWAAEAGQTKVVSFLLQAGADKNAIDAKGMTALMHAAENIHTVEAVDALLKAGADPNRRDKEGRTALQIAEKAKNLSYPPAQDVIKLLKPVTKL